MTWAGACEARKGINNLNSLLVEYWGDRSIKSWSHEGPLWYDIETCSDVYRMGVFSILGSKKLVLLRFTDKQGTFDIAQPFDDLDAAIAAFHMLR